MGQELIKIYNAIAAEGQLKAKMELAKITKMPSTQAAIEPDSSENIEKFKKAYKEITGKDYVGK